MLTKPNVAVSVNSITKQSAFPLITEKNQRYCYLYDAILERARVEVAEERAKK